MYLPADLRYRQDGAEAQRSREMSATSLKTFRPVRVSSVKIF
jgi:hypothetical protein